MVAIDDEPCSHPPTLLRHLGRSLYGCLDCDHTGHLQGRPYFCGTCPEVHSKTWEEILEHYKTTHPYLLGVKEDG